MTILQQVLSIAVATITILGAIFGVFLWLLARFREVDARLQRIERRLDLLQVQAGVHGHQLQNLFRGMTAIVGVLSRIPGLPHGELTRALFGAMETAEIAKIVQSLETGNPFTTDEGERLRTYYEMGRRGDPFTPDEARDFYRLSQRATQELPTSDVVWNLFFVAGVLLVIYALSQEK